MNADEIGKILDEIGNRLSPAGQYVWNAAVASTRIFAISGIVLLLLAWVVGTWLALKGRNVTEKEWSNFSLNAGLTFVGVVLLIGAFIGTVSVGPELISNAFVPEWGVVKSFIPE